jgi:transketolase
LKGKGNFQAPGSTDETIQGAVSGSWGYDGANIAFGVREHAMGSILNGMALHGGLLPYGSTFLIFSDYMRPAIRLATLMKLHVIYVFTHDSVAVGEDGPTHQPVEHLFSLRAIPGLTVIRPADANEVAEAWRIAVENKNGPTALILTRQNVPVMDRGRFHPATGLRKGAYILSDSPSIKPEVILMATGSEVHLALEAQEKLLSEGIKTRVVSMPSWELFEQQPEKYRREVLPPGVTKRVSIEAGVTLGWHRYVGREGEIIGIDHFGASAPGNILLKEFGFAAENILRRVKSLLTKKRGK